MKRILSIVGVTAVMAACNSNPQPGVGNTNVAAAPTSVVTLTDTTGLAEFQAWKAQKTYAAANTVVYVPVQKAATRSTRSTATAKRKTNYGSASTQTQYPAKPAKKGWSKAAKGAAIGAGSGAVIGAVVNKRNRVVGGVIGGVVGAGVGYGIGRHMDKKDGRY